MSNITCYIYRCSAKADMYIYLLEKDNFDCVPDKLKNNMGTTLFAMQLELSNDKKLAKENPAVVIENLQSKGFHLQMPSNTPIDEILRKIAHNEQLKS